MSTDETTLDGFFRRKLGEAQNSITAICMDSAAKQIIEATRPMELALGTKVEILTRDCAAMRGHLAKVNEIKNTLIVLDGEVKRRPTQEDVDKDMSKLNDYPTLKSFKQLQRIVYQKTEYDEFQ